MDDELSEDPACANPVTPSAKEHWRRNEEQAELLRKVYRRSRHAAYVEEALRRAGRRREGDESNGTSGC